jgi:cytochrome c biogenesis protein CcdA/glutaredoxin
VLAVVATLLLTAVFVPGAGAAEGDESRQPELVLFWGDGCPHCAAEKEWLPSIAQSYPQLRITMYEVWNDAANQQRLVDTAARLGFKAGPVPVTIVGDQYWIGWSDTLRPEIETAIRAEVQAAEPAPGPTAPSAAGESAAKSVDVPWVGPVDVGSTSLVASTLVIGFVDGVNPCSLWVISVLLAIVVRTGSRRRVLATGGTFLVVTAAMYAVFIAGVYSALNVVSHLGAIQWVVAAVAAVFGVVSVKDYFAFKRGLSFTIPDSSKPGLYKRMRQAAGPQALAPALGATAVLAVAVSLLETPCTAGFPVLWTGLLEANGVSTAQAAALFVLYMVPFLVDELLVFGVAVVTLRSTKLQERHGRLLKLVAGTMMLALAVTVLVSPEAMSSPATALGVFAAAFAAAGTTHLVTRAVRGKDWAASRS